MPQSDISSFASIVFWTFVVYTFGYLYLSASELYAFIANTKVVGIRSGFVARAASLRTLSAFSWISLSA